METRYRTEILKTTNKSTDKITYFKKVCDYMTRITKTDYDEILDTCDGVGSLFEESTKKLVRKFTTCIFYTDVKR